MARWGVNAAAGGAWRGGIRTVQAGCARGAIQRPAVDDRSAPLKLPPDATCLGCGYSLRALTVPRCPECGREFEPADARTYRRPPFVTPPPQADRLRRPFEWNRYAQPPHALALVACVLVAGIELWESSYPMADATFGEFAGLTSCCALWLLPVALIVDYLTRILAIVGRDPAGWRPRRKRRVWRWAILPVCSVLFASALLIDWPLELRFALSRKALEQEALATAGSGEESRRARWIGLYYVRAIRTRRTDPPAVLFVTNESHVLDEIFTMRELEAGFCYRPVGPGPRSIESLGGGWYVETCEYCEVPD